MAIASSSFVVAMTWTWRYGARECSIPVTTFLPGSLVRCRDREWVVLPSDEPDLLLLRPLGGSGGEIAGVHLGLSRALGVDTVVPATFPPPEPEHVGDVVAGRLLADAARLLFRSGAGPFRSLGRIAVRPRPFQIVPLLMALRLDPVRLLIADDVGVGKTIEAALVARELLDRGDAQRLCVLCPPHLCEQWQRELAEKFAIDAVVVRSSTLAALERGLPPGDVSVFEHYPALVVSIDFVKGERRRDSFLRGCPELVIVDEAHTAARASGTRMAQQRHELLRDLARDAHRHLLLLTATPHSGVEDAFRSLLELLDPSFGRLNLEQLTEQNRRALARHFVQRRRADVQRWLGQDDVTPFPSRDPREVTYRLARSPEYRALFDDIYAFARELVRSHDGGLTVWKQRVRYWTALALLRCVMSSPAAAEATLRARISRLAASAEGTEDDRRFADYVLDLSDQEAPQDLDPAPVVEEGQATATTGERRRLQEFARRSAKLRGEADPKLLAAVEEIGAMLRDGFRPIVYCRYIATAEYLATELQKRLQKDHADLRVVAVTGASAEEEREQRVAELAQSPRRVLVATDCLSEGINLQHDFDAVLHYDLPWNPNRLEQREGRVDRYGQPAQTVRTTLFYGVDNQIDEAVLRVLLRKAVSIHKMLGISVPLPVESESVVETVVRSLFQEQVTQQDMFAEALPVDIDQMHRDWDRAAARERESRTRFAQHAIKPEEVAQELYESDVVLGSAQTVADFVLAACQRLGGEGKKQKVKGKSGELDSYLLALDQLPAVVRERVAPVFAARRGAKLPETALIGFVPPLPEGVQLIGRLHPLTEALAEHLVDLAMEGANPLVVSRTGVLRSADVARRTTLLLLRLRLLIETPGRGAPTMAEELIVAGYEGRLGSLQWLNESTARRLLETAKPVGNLTDVAREEALVQAIAWLTDLEGDLNAIANARAVALHEAHRRVRQATRTGRVTVRANLPLDVLGVYVLLPVPKGMTR
jgi:superfamily II DNA or RNA helicase